MVSEAGTWNDDDWIFPICVSSKYTSASNDSTVTGRYPCPSTSTSNWISNVLSFKMVFVSGIPYI